MRDIKVISIQITKTGCKRNMYDSIIILEQYFWSQFKLVILDNKVSEIEFYSWGPGDNRHVSQHYLPRMSQSQARSGRWKKEVKSASCKFGVLHYKTWGGNCKYESITIELGEQGVTTFGSLFQYSSLNCIEKWSKTAYFGLKSLARSSDKE